MFSHVYLERDTYARCIGTRIRIVRTGPPPATTIFHSNRRIEKYWWLGRFYRVICQTTMDLVPPCRSDTAGDLTLRAEKCVKLPLSSNRLRPEKREISYARYYTSYNAKIYVILVVGDIVTCQKWMDKSPLTGRFFSGSIPDSESGYLVLWKLQLRSWIQLSGSTLIFPSFLSVPERLIREWNARLLDTSIVSYVRIFFAPLFENRKSSPSRSNKCLYPIDAFNQLIRQVSIRSIWQI